MRLREVRTLNARRPTVGGAPLPDPRRSHFCWGGASGTAARRPSAPARHALLSRPLFFSCLEVQNPRGVRLLSHPPRNPPVVPSVLQLPLLFFVFHIFCLLPSFSPSLPPFHPSLSSLPSSFPPSLPPFHPASVDASPARVTPLLSLFGLLDGRPFARTVVSEPSRGKPPLSVHPLLSPHRCSALAHRLVLASTPSSSFSVSASYLSPFPPSTPSLLFPATARRHQSQLHVPALPRQDRLAPSPSAPFPPSPRAYICATLFFFSRTPTWPTPFYASSVSPSGQAQQCLLSCFLPIPGASGAFLRCGCPPPSSDRLFPLPFGTLRLHVFSHLCRHPHHHLTICRHHASTLRTKSVSTALACCARPLTPSAFAMHAQRHNRSFVEPVPPRSGLKCVRRSPILTLSPSLSLSLPTSLPVVFRCPHLSLSLTPCPSW